MNRYAGHEKVSRTVLSEKNSGSPFRQWKRGIELSRGDYIWIAESDDWADENFLQRLLEQAGEGADLVYCRSVKVDGEGEVISDEFWPDSLDSQRWRDDFTSRGREELYGWLCYRNTIPSASACLFRKKPDLFTDEILASRYTGDWLFWVRYLADANLSYLAEPLNFHRTHAGATRMEKDPDARYGRLVERLRAVREARRLGGRGRILYGEVRRYKYLIRSINELRKVPDATRPLWRTVPPELMIYTLLVAWRDRLRKGVRSGKKGTSSDGPKAETALRGGDSERK